MNPLHWPNGGLYGSWLHSVTRADGSMEPFGLACGNYRDPSSHTNRPVKLHACHVIGPPLAKLTPLKRDLGPLISWKITENLRRTSKDLNTGERQCSWPRLNRNSRYGMMSRMKTLVSRKNSSSCLKSRTGQRTNKTMLRGKIRRNFTSEETLNTAFQLRNLSCETCGGRITVWGRLNQELPFH